MRQCNGKWPICLVYVWKPLITEITAIGNWCFDRQPLRQRGTNRNGSCPYLLGWLVYIIKLQYCLFNCSVIRPAMQWMFKPVSLLDSHLFLRKCEKKSTSNVKSNVFLTYHAVNQVDRSQRLKRSMILWRQKSVVVEGWGVDHLPTRKLRHQSIRHWMLFLLVSRSLMEFDKNVVAKWLVANLRGSEMTKKRMNAV